jgi:dATP pyrophosphohydrolase
MFKRTTQVEVIVFKIINNEVIFLLLKRNKQKGGFWQPITGGVEENEGLDQAAKRELREETSITEYLRIINNVHYFEFDTDDLGVLKEYVFGVQIEPDVKIEISPEHVEMRWCSLDESLKLLKYENNKIGFKKLFSLLTIQKP